jgi:hypothetical protein
MHRKKNEGLRARITLTASLPMLLVAAGCSGGDPSSQPDETATQQSTVRATSTPATAAPMPALPTGGTEVAMDPAQFSSEITNRYWPMKPGTRWTYREVLDDGTVSEAVVVATTTTKKIANGVIARVVRDTARSDGTIIEDTNDWYAQDSAGNVWYLGEDTATVKKGRIVSRAGSWEAGVKGAQAGVIVPADPERGARYRQEYYKGHAEDNGEVLSTSELVQAPTGRYRNSLLTKDTSSIETTAWEYKLYAPGVGPVVTLGISGDVGREELIKLDKARPSDGTGPLGTPDG